MRASEDMTPSKNTKYKGEEIMNFKAYSKKHHFIGLTGLTVLFLLAACAGPELKVEPVKVSDSPAEAVARLENKLAAGMQNKINVLSPGWYEKAEISLSEARRALKQGGEMAKIRARVSQGLTEYKQAEEMARTASASIPDAIQARDRARTAGATAFGEEYAEIEKSFLKLTGEIEDNNLAYAKKNQKKVANAFHELEIRAIKENTLGEVRELISKAEAEGAAKLATKLLAEAKKELSEVDSFITSNPYETEEMRARAAVARFKAARLVQLVKQSRKIEEMKPLDISLWVEDILKKAADKLSAADMRDQTFETQTENIFGSIESLVKDRDFLLSKAKNQQAEIEKMRSLHPMEIARLKEQHAVEMDTLKTRHDEEIGELTKKIAALEGKSREEAEKAALLLAEQRAARERLAAEKRAEEARLESERLEAERKLAAERRFNELYSKVSAMFSEDEAECYKQGLRLVIRLRSMQFPVGQSIIMPDNYPLLSKVQRAIRTFGEPSVIIEGHTDSTGTPEVNNLLSQQRADAVREYMLANGVVKEEQIVAAGYGPSRPLAPNTTAEGRAVNRRIDVVITPESQSSP